MSAQDRPQTHDGHESAEKDLRNLEKVRAIFVSLAKFVNAQRIYVSSNPNLIRFANAFDQAFRTFFEDENELLLTVAQYQLIWRDQVVYDIGPDKESIAFLLYKDGVGEITIHSSVERTELEQFVAILQSEIYDVSAQFDIVTKLWQSEFTDIFYRVVDEQSDGADGEGEGAGSASREQPLNANDHQNLPDTDTVARTSPSYTNESIDSLGRYLNAAVDRNHPQASAHVKEEHLQEILNGLFATSPEELVRWHDKIRARNDRDELISLLSIMLDYTQTLNSPPVIRDVTDTIERLVRYIREEANVPTLIAALDIQRRMASESLEKGFASLPGRIEAELTDSMYLASLGKAANESSKNVHDVLGYFRLVGESAVAGLCELLAGSIDSSIHEEVCELLIEIAGDDILRIVEEFDVENPYLAKDAVYLLWRSSANDVSPVIKKIVSSPNARNRQYAIEYLVHLGNEESARLLCNLLYDANEGVRVKTLVAVEGFQSPLIIDEVTSLCFTEHDTPKSTDELEHMFRALGKLAGTNVLTRIRQAVEKKRWIPGGKSRNKRSKLLAITALRHIPGAEAQSVLEKLSHDGDNLIRTKALYVLKQRREPTDAGDELTPAGAGTRGVQE